MVRLLLLPLLLAGLVQRAGTRCVSVPWANSCDEDEAAQPGTLAPDDASAAPGLSASSSSSSAAATAAATAAAAAPEEDAAVATAASSEEDAAPAASSSPSNGTRFIALRCRPNRAYLRVAPHRTLGSFLLAEMAESLLAPRQAIFELAEAGPSHVTLRSAHDGGLLTMTSGTDRPSWMLTTKVATEADALFRLERLDDDLADDRKWTARLYSERVGAYVNCLHGSAIRGHASVEKKKGYERLPARKEEGGTHLELNWLPDTALAKAPTLSDANPGGPPAPSQPQSGPKPPKRKQQQQQRKPPAQRDDMGPERRRDVTASCNTACSTPADANGYAPVAFAAPLDEYVCPSMFRDLADWVYAWPWKHFGENVWIANSEVASKCLADVPLVYAHANTVAQVVGWASKKLKRPFILLSGQSDFAASRYKSSLNDPRLLKWFAQNADIDHPKLVKVPIGLNCFEHAPEMHLARKPSNVETRNKKLVWVNFGNTHSGRKVVWDHFCGSAGRPAMRSSTCTQKSQKNNVRGNPHLVAFYSKIAEHKYVVAPRGNGIDTHRLWEALYLGCVPIVQTSPLDPLFRRAGVMVVRNFRDVTADLLEREWPRHSAVLANATRLLSRAFWQGEVEAVRDAFLAKSSSSRNANNRSRCFGPK